MTIVNSLYAIGVDSNGILQAFGYSPNTVNGIPAPEIEFPDGLTITSYNDYASYIADLNPLLLIKSQINKASQMIANQQQIAAAQGNPIAGTTDPIALQITASLSANPAGQAQNIKRNI
jgi:hypothetical protein